MRALKKQKVKSKPGRGGRRANVRSRSGFGWKLIEDISFGRVRNAPANLAAFGFIALVLIYSMFAGGYFSAALYAAGRSIDRVAHGAGFAVTEIKISGRDNVDRLAILQALDLKKDQSIFRFSVTDAKQRIERFGWVHAASVSRLLPSTISVIIDERRPMAIWQRDKLFFVIDSKGKPLSDKKIADYAALPLIVGHGAAVHARALLDDLEAQPTIKSMMKAAIRVGDRRWNIQLRNDISVLLPELKTDEALAELVRLEAEQGLLSRDVKTIDMRIPDRMTIELGDQAAAQRKASLVKNGSKGPKKGKRI